MTDWMGNEIKAGMEICFIRVIDRQMYRFGYIIPSYPVEGVHIEHMEEKRPDKPCWEIGQYHKVERNLRIKSDLKDGFTLYNSLNLICYGMDDTEIIAIKGISDKEELYESYRK